MIILLLTALAFGGDIVQVPSDSEIMFPANEVGDVPDPMTVVEFSFLMPESMYDNALAKAKKLAIVEPELESCYETSDFWMRQSKEAMDLSVTQFDADAEWQTRALTAEDKARRATVQRNTAYAITTTVVATFIGATYLANRNDQ